MISGITAGFTGAMFGSFAFISTYNNMTHYIYTHPTYGAWDFRLKNLCIFMTAEVAGAFGRIFFETRKQILQMCNTEIRLKEIL